MPYLVKPDVDRFGYLAGGDELLPVDAGGHSWLQPYPTLDGELNLAWTVGDDGTHPQVYAHNVLRDFVCTAEALELLSEFSPGDFHVFAQGRLGRDILQIVQVTAVLDVVDEERSLRGSFSWSGIDFPQIDSQVEGDINRRIFRVPNRGLGLSYFMGDELKEEFMARAISGFTFAKTEVGN